MKKDIKNIEASVRALLQNKAKEIEKFLIEPLGAVNKEQKFNGGWKAPGPWK